MLTILVLGHTFPCGFPARVSLRLTNFARLKRCLLKHDIFIEESLADGNCLLWSIRVLLHGDPEIENESPEAYAEQAEIWEDLSTCVCSRYMSLLVG